MPLYAYSNLLHLQIKFSSYEFLYWWGSIWDYILNKKLLWIESIYKVFGIFELFSL